jgi:hypothetical protein
MENRQDLRRSCHSAVVAATTVLALAATVGGWQPQAQLGNGRLAKPCPTPSELRLPPVDLVPVKVELPTAQFNGTPKDIRASRVKPVQTKAGPPFLAPAGTKNVALGKPVSSSDSEPVIGELAMVTDGDKEASEGSFVELGPLLQHVTIDLQAEHVIYGIRLWHYHQQPRVYFDVVIQVANDPNFTTGGQTVFNNDMDDSVGLGLGQDMHYVDTHFGELFDAKAVRCRYVRLHSRGSTTDDLNHYIEVEVYGKPVMEVPELVPLQIEMPKPTLQWQPIPIDSIPCLEPEPIEPPRGFLVPKGMRNVALGKPVSADSYATIGELDMITDGRKQATNETYVELPPGAQSITIDLGATHTIYAIQMWHWVKFRRVYHDIIVQISDDPDHITGVQTVFNNDMDHSAGLGIGRDWHYIETRYGKLLDAAGARGRYVRFHSNGNSGNDLNHYVEVEVYGKPVR